MPQPRMLLAAGQAPGTSPAGHTGYAGALDQAQALSLKVLTQVQGPGL